MKARKRFKLQLLLHRPNKSFSVSSTHRAVQFHDNSNPPGEPRSFFHRSRYRFAPRNCRKPAPWKMHANTGKLMLGYTSTPTEVVIQQWKLVCLVKIRGNNWTSSVLFTRTICLQPGASLGRCSSSKMARPYRISWETVRWVTKNVPLCFMQPLHGAAPYNCPFPEYGYTSLPTRIAGLKRYLVNTQHGAGSSGTFLLKFPKFVVPPRETILRDGIIKCKLYELWGHLGKTLGIVTIILFE